MQVPAPESKKKEEMMLQYGNMKALKFRKNIRLSSMKRAQLKLHGKSKHNFDGGGCRERCGLA